jgi:hypothetical protein
VVVVYRSVDGWSFNPSIPWLSNLFNHLYTLYHLDLCNSLSATLDASF